MSAVEGFAAGGVLRGSDGASLYVCARSLLRLGRGVRGPMSCSSSIEAWWSSVLGTAHKTSRFGAETGKVGPAGHPGGPPPLSAARPPAAYSLVVRVITIMITSKTTRSNDSSAMATSTQRRRRPKGTWPRAPIRCALCAGWGCANSVAGTGSFRQSRLSAIDVRGLPQA